MLTAEKLLIKNTRLSHLTKRSIWLAIESNSGLYSCRLKEVNHPDRPPEPYSSFGECRYEIIAHDLIVFAFPRPGECRTKRPFQGDIRGVDPIEIDGKMWVIEDALLLPHFLKEE